MGSEEIDETDREILQLLMQDPRMPYAEIADRLAEMDRGLSAESVRRRVTELFEESSIFLLTGPRGRDWEVVRVNVTVTDTPGAADTVFDRMDEHDFWLVCRGFGTVDVHAVATVAGLQEADELVDAIRGLEEVASVSYFLETERRTDMRSYTLE